MQIRCSYCQTMIPISRDEMLAALQQMELHKQIFYDAHCPRCRRSNRVEKKKIEILIPNWKKVIKDMEHAAMEMPEVKKAVEKPVKSEAKTGEKKQDKVKSTSKKTTTAPRKKTTNLKPITSTKKAVATKEKITTKSKKVKAK